MCSGSHLHLQKNEDWKFMKYILGKIISLVFTLFLVSVITFAAFSVIPGDPARVMLGVNATDSQVAHLRTDLGLDKPLVYQYVHWLEGAVTGNLGKSVSTGETVSDLIGQRLPVTLTLGLIALLLTLLFSFPLGLFSAQRPGKALDHIISVISHMFASLPPFVLGLLLTLVLGFIFHLFVAGNYVSYQTSLSGFVGCLFVPALAIALPKIAMTVKFLRSSILAEKDKDYVRTAKSHGLTDGKILVQHILPNALIPVLTMLAIITSDILGGSLIVEQTFNLPGLGRLLLQAISGRDFPLLEGIVLYLAALVVLINFFMELAYCRVDPRIRLA
jgi:peptide/nickel transport system permease protein